MSKIHYQTVNQEQHLGLANFDVDHLTQLGDNFGNSYFMQN